jgi:hypothetical protein
MSQIRVSTDGQDGTDYGRICWRVPVSAFGSAAQPRPGAAGLPNADLRHLRDLRIVFL